MSDALEFNPPEKDFLKRRTPEERDVIRPFAFSRHAQRYLNLWEEGQVTPPRDQRPCNTCTSFGLAASLEARHLTETGESVDLATGWMHRCIMNASCRRGLDLTRVVFKLEGEMIPLAYEGSYPWNKEECDFPGTIHFSGFQMFTDDFDFFDALIQGAVVAVGMDIDSEFKNWRGGRPYKLTDGKQRYQHVVALIGYDADAGVWIAKNSLGESWGDEGFFTVPFGHCGIGSDYVGYGAVPLHFERGNGNALIATS